jgi:UDP-GlcNAc:undecaprenyl-phosphate GlcNAc-1-phosphate transferase
VVVLFAWPQTGPGGKIDGIVMGAIGALVLGLVDDLKGLKPLTRLLAQAALAFGAAWGGLTAGLFRSPVPDIALTVIVVVSAMNAVNLLDGMDGLASGVVAICCAAFAVFSYARGDQPVFVVTSAALAAFMGFLPYNFHPASVFLGNSGSSLAGFLLAGLMLLSLRAAPTPTGFIGSLLIVGLPAADTALAIGRRIKAGRRITSGDRDHFYDKLLRKGFSQKQSALIAYTAAASFAALGLAILLAGG